MKLPPIPELLKLYSIKPSRKLSQNFLKTPKPFCEHIRVDKNTLVVEIGCGPGSITRQLLKKCPKVVGIEIDERFDPILSQLRDYHDGKFQFLIADALKDRETSTKILEMANDIAIDSVVIVGNLPFAIAGRLLSQFNHQCLSKDGLFAYPVEMVLMFSKAMGDRLLPTHPKRTQFGAITNTAFDVSLHRIFPKSEFVPRPQDDAIALMLKSRQTKLFEDKNQVDRFMEFMASVYKLPNKQASVAFSKLANCKIMLEKHNVDPKTRMYDIPLALLVELSKDYISMNI